jgi:lipid-A-disaccharide synthase
MPQVAIIAGEASGDRLGASLITAALALRPDLKFAGVAGPAMKQAGCETWYDSRELAVMGLFEVVRHLPRLRRLKAQLERKLLAERPNLVIGIDAPDFNLRVERVVRRAGIPTVHYVCPSVWAWRPGRVKTIRESCDLVLCLLPFEPDFLAKHRIAAEFVGHPLADEIPARVDRGAARRQLGLPESPVIAILPGSRHSEVERLGPLFAQTIAWLSAHREGVSFAAPMATPELRKQFAAELHRHASSTATHLFDGQAQPVIAASDVVLVASGTATLEAMLLKRPMVVAYRVSPLSAALVRLFRLIRADFAALPNLLAGRQLVPEFLQERATPEALGGALLEILDSPAKVTVLQEQFAALHGRLRCGAGERAARAALGAAGLL